MPDKPYAETAQEASEQAVRRTREAIDDAAKKARSRAKEFSEAAADRIDETRAPVAEALHQASDKLDQAAQNIPADPVRRAARSAADRLERGARYVEEHDTSEMAGDLMRVVKRHPVPSMIIAACAGFILARSIRRH